MKLLYILALFAFHCSKIDISNADDRIVQHDAVSSCMNLHYTRVNGVKTVYANKECLLMCQIHGVTNVHNVNEGLPCPLAKSSGTCHQGQCVPNDDTLGYVDVQLIGASLTHNASAIVVSDVRNTTNADNKFICSTQYVLNRADRNVQQTNFEWGVICEDSVHFTFSKKAQLKFELYDQPNTAAGHLTLIGSISMTIADWVNHGYNNKAWTLPLMPAQENSFTNDSITARVTWTPVVL